MNLAKIQALSLGTKAVTTALGIIQSVIVVRILSPAEYGLVGLVMSVGGVIGVTQHLGIVDGAIREIAVLKNKREAAAVFWVSHLVRQAVTIPLSIGLILLAGFVAGSIYHRPEIALLIQIYAAVLILQGLQDVMGATLTGLKRFVSLYVVQIVTAAINVAVFGYATWRFGTVGFFWAIVITTTIMIILLTIIVARSLRGELRWPGIVQINKYSRRVMRVGAYMYLARIFFVIWQRLPLLLLGGVLTADSLGYLNVSLTFGSKLTIIAMALSEVNLSWMSSLYAQRQNEFRRVVTRNMHRVLLLMMLLTLVLLYFAPEILQYVIGAEYLPARQIILIVTAAFFLYALTDIGTSSVFVSADEPRLRAIIYGAMTTVTAVTVGWILWQRPDAFWASGGVLGGAVVAYLITVIFTKKHFGIALVTGQLGLLLAALGLSVGWLLTEPLLLVRTAVFILLTAYVIYEANRSNLLPGFLKVNRRQQDETGVKIICFAGAVYNQFSWTNRQQIMTRLAQKYPVFYVEPRVWVLRYVIRNWRKPLVILGFFQRVLAYKKINDNFYVKAQWNLIPGSRELRWVGQLNYWLNKFSVLAKAKWLGFRSGKQVMWIYDTEAAEYVSSFKKALVVYDCVDDHAAQAGPDRNEARVKEEEAMILKRADLVTVTSQKLFQEKRRYNANTHLVLNAGDTKLYAQAEQDKKKVPSLERIAHPIIGSVGALDSYKLDLNLIRSAAELRPEWQFVFVGEPIVDGNRAPIVELAKRPNVHLLGGVDRKDVPRYVSYFDVCAIPYQSSSYNNASFPLKFWEFMATGKPVVVTGLPELKRYADLIDYAISANDFIELIAKSLDSDNSLGRQRLQLAEKHSWEARVAELDMLLQDVVSRK
ncbi:MAG: oligosaccharide flippase family protein [Candidatus Andersenbacteria bacterium]|nr:oligosaccharide flippase family protein [bacterium]MDZ4225812.1 oligosaccharide flippase family protein [Candidatus Andersenbacteria bacterium]